MLHRLYILECALALSFEIFTKTMASKAILQSNLELQLKTLANKNTELDHHSPFPLEILNLAEAEPATTTNLSKYALENPVKHIAIDMADQMSNHHQNGSINTAPERTLPKKIYLSNRNVEQTPKQGDVLELSQLSWYTSLDGNENLIKKISEQSSFKNSPASVKVSDETSSLTKSSGSAKMSDPSEFAESGTSMSSILRASTSSDVSDGNSCSSSLSSSISKPHKSNDLRWEAIQAVRSRDRVLGLSHFKLLKKLGCGDIGSVYLSKLSGMKCYFAMKVMDKGSLANRKKLLRAQTEREILQSLDHPFLPTLYTHFETDKFSCFVMEFCPGGDLHTLRQRQPCKHFSEKSVKFYVSEVLLALEYLHMLGIIYRDLKPENVLIREDGHIMLSDFDLSLRCAVNPTLVKTSNPESKSLRRNNTQVYCIQPTCIEPTCIQPSCVAPTTCFGPRLFSSKSKKDQKLKVETGKQVNPLPELIVEPTDARSMSFVGTHEYLAPEIIKGEGHGSAVDWWTFGIFLYELLFGKTPFKGSDNRATLFNVVGQPLHFPESPMVSFSARDLIKGLLVREPQQRLAFKRGASEIKQHPFFEGVNWALIRCATPPEIPKLVEVPSPISPTNGKIATGTDQKGSDSYLEFDAF